MPEADRQAILDAAAVLQARRTEAATTAAAGGSPEITVVGRGREINRWLFRASEGWQDLRSVRPSSSAEEMRVSLANNRAQVQRGMHMESISDLRGTDVKARILLANETHGTYLLSFAPVQTKIVDRRLVLLQGPFVEGEQTVIAVTSRPCVDAAWRYWDAVLAAAIPVAEAVDPLGDLSPRQQQVVALLATGAGDDAIATALGVSVRTVRSEVAHILDALGVQSRFAAGARLRHWPAGEATP